MSENNHKFAASALLERGQQLLASGDYEMGIQFLKKALEQEPNNLDIVECLGDALMEVGDVANAEILFKHSISLDPEESGTKWMYLAQLQQGKEALTSFKKGIEVLTRKLKTVGEAATSGVQGDDELLLKLQLCSGLCSIAELYMSDLCFEPDAEEQCDEALQQALEYGPQNPEVLQSMASFRISQQRPEDAKTLMDQALVAQGFKNMLKADNNMEEEDTPAADDTSSNIPYEFRVTTGRILVELAKYNEAIVVLERLLKEDDEVIEVWALLGQCHIALKDFDAAKECFEQAETMLKAFLAVDPNDEQFISHMKRIEQLSKQIPEEVAGGGKETEMETD